MGAAFFKTGKEKLSDIPISIWTISVKDIDGNVVELSKYQENKALIIVNVASSCGLTLKQYKGLNSLYEQYQSKGLEILAFPCNQFMGQENKCEVDIKEFLKAMKVKFPAFSKIDVNGKNAHPLFKFLRAKSRLYDSKKGTYQEIPWNFAKFLVNKEGVVVELFAPDVAPEDLIKKIEPLL